jgi:hypothetical protein
MRARYLSFLCVSAHPFVHSRGDHGRLIHVSIFDRIAADVLVPSTSALRTATVVAPGVAILPVFANDAILAHKHANARFPGARQPQRASVLLPSKGLASGFVVVALPPDERAGRPPILIDPAPVVSGMVLTMGGAERDRIIAGNPSRPTQTARGARWVMSHDPELILGSLAGSPVVAEDWLVGIIEGRTDEPGKWWVLPIGVVMEDAVVRDLVAANPPVTNEKAPPADEQPPSRRPTRKAASRKQQPQPAPSESTQEPPAPIDAVTEPAAAPSAVEEALATNETHESAVPQFVRAALEQSVAAGADEPSADSEHAQGGQQPLVSTATEEEEEEEEQEEQKQQQEDGRAELDEAAFFERLSPGARHALAHAEGIRVAQGLDRIHMDQLVFGLSKIQGGATASVLAAAGVSLDRLKELLEEGTDIPLPQSHAPVPLGALPPLSSHARLALANALRIADDDGSPQIEHRHLLLGALHVRHCGAIAPLLRENIDPRLIFTRIPELRIGGSRVGGTLYHADTPEGPDHLDIGRDVDALAAVVAAENTPLPLSIGLLGDWGSGKSFFMKKLEERIRAEKGKPGSCSSVVHLWFNAWHYIDTNLWASLAASIFEGLARELDGGGVEGNRKQRANLKARILERTAHLRDVQAQAETRKRHLSRELRDEEGRLKQLDDEDRTLARQLSAGELARAAYRHVVRTPEVARKLDELAETTGLPAGRLAVEEARAELLRMNGARRRVWMAWQMVRDESPGRRAALIAGLILLPAAALALAGGGFVYLADQLGASGVGVKVIDLLQAAAGALALGVGAVTAALRPVWGKLSAGWRIVREAKRAGDQKLGEQRRKRRDALEGRRDRIRQARVETEQQIQATSQELQVLAEQLAELHPDREMGKFIRERSGSSDYTRHLGVIARARGDFQKLTDCLKEVLRPREEGETPADTARIDRIVLYIDDLDRCPEDKVVEVLQAVHLLLAFELFVVVVGVDSRWLLHSLRQHSRALDRPDEENEAMAEPDRGRQKSTPLNYLEKIFQVPFTLRPMGLTGYQTLVEELSAPRDFAAYAETVEPPPGGTPPVEEADATGEDATLAVFPEPGGDADPGDHARDLPSDTASAADAVASTRTSGAALQLDLSPWERRFLAALYPLIPTPRAAKRLLNVYRLMRGGLDERELRHVAGDEHAGQYRAVLLLLGMLTGYPAEATVVLRDLVENEPDAMWWDYLGRLSVRRLEVLRGQSSHDPFDASEDADQERWDEMLRKLQSIRGLVPADFACEAFVKWAPEVGRYSFHSGRLLARTTRAAEEMAAAG